MKNIDDSPARGEIILYKSDDGPELQLALENETLWLSQAQLAELFGKERQTIIEHIKNIYKEGELKESSTTRKFRVVQTEGKRQVSREIEHYNLDMVISVGYRVNSKKGTQFRIWATQKLRDYLMKGYLVNEKRLREAHENRLKELQQAHAFIHQALEAKRLYGYEKELAGIINDYTQTWVILNRYDEGDLELAKQNKGKLVDLTYERAKKAIEHFRDRLMEAEYASGTFGRERSSVLSEILNKVSQENASLEEKAALLFYETIKNRPFVDGNKRIASLLFVVYLIENRYLYDKKGERKFNDNALIALALLIEESKPSEKQTMIMLIANLTNKK
jgi:prophage maintenance system killer protein